MSKVKWIATFLLAGMLLSGCASKNEETSIYFLSRKPEVSAIWQEIGEAYEAETGIPVKVLTSAGGNHERILQAELAKKDTPTIFQITGPVEYQRWKNYCRDLADTELYSWLLDKDMAVKDGEKVVAIPYVVEGYGIIYNDAIMQKYFSLSSKGTTFKSVSEINTYDKLKSVVEDMTNHKNELGIKGVFASTSLAGGEDWRWQTHLANLPVYYEFKDKGVSDTEILDFTYSKNYQNIFDLYINYSCTDKAQLGNKRVSDSIQEFAMGEAAMLQNGNWAWTDIKGIEGNKVTESDIKFMPIYTGTSEDATQGLCIGTENYICINTLADEADQQAAIDFLEWLYSSEAGKNYVTNELDFITPFNTFTEAELPNNPLAKEVVSYMNNQDLTSVSWNFTAFPSQTFKNNLGTGLLEYCNGLKSWNEIVNDAKAEWAAEKSGQ